MSRILAATTFLSIVLVGCSEPGDGAPPGYRRFVTPPMTLAPGQSGQWVQYVSEPMAEDMDVVDIIGSQGPGGHHAILYASPTIEPVGSTRDWTTIDQVADRFLGGIGGEGAEEIRLPEGAVFRIPAGNALYVNTHYLNTGDAEITTSSQLDVKLEPASPDRRAVGLFSNIDISFRLPPGQATTREVTCTTADDLDVVMFSNHLHDFGVSMRTTITPPGGEPIVLKDDPSWSYEWTANPNFERRTVAEPLRIAAGTTITSACAWNNTSAREVLFPDEMCLFIAFHLEHRDIACVDGDWTE